MPSDYTFRLSTYLTLALSCLCLGYAEWDLLPEAAVFAVVVIGLLAVSFRAEGRFELDIKSANRVGLVIAVVAGVWLTYQFLNYNSLIYTFPWPASLLPYLGPLLMVLMPAKMFRSKNVGDWWAIQGIGLAGVGLASAMAEDEIFGVLLGLYAVAGMWALILFFYRREAGTLPPMPGTDPGPTPAVVAARTSRRPGRAALLRALGWLALAAAVALPAFFLTPRSDAPRWQFGKSRLETGYSGEQMIDLNRTGDVGVNREVAFTVRATYPDGRPVEDLSPSQRWRGVAYNQYDSGKWGRTEGAPVAAAGAAVPLRPGPDYALPDLGPDQYVLDFTPRMRRADPILADPAAWAVGVPPPVCALLRDGGRHAWWQASDGSFRPIRAADIRAGYRQVTRPPAEPDLGPPFALSVPLPEALHQVQSPIVVHRNARLPRLRSWTVDRLTELARTDPRIQAALDRADRRIDFRTDPADYEVVAQTLCEYLRTSPEYTYTLKLRRQDRASDPIEDFLFRTKAGHCERFAAGLALMLRAVGVPAAYVLGFKGLEYDGDGVYVVRQEHAHAWVEVLVPRPTPQPPPPWAQGRPEVWHWLSLDPTPGGDEGADAESLAGQLGAARETLVEFFLDFIVGYNPERRREAVDAVREWVRGNAGWLIGVPAAVLLAAAGRRLWRRVRGWERAANGGAGTGLAWFDRLGWVLARYGHPAPVGATPAEHAAAVTEHLRGDRRTAAVADVPLEVTRAFYLARYADRPPAPAEAARLAADVDRLEAALRSAPRRLPSP